MTYLLRIIFISAIVCISFFSAKADYKPEEFAFIPWGDEPHQLKIEMPVWVDVNNTPEDSTDDLMEGPPAGPTQVIIDQFQNIYVSSYGLDYLKGFDSSGRLIIDFSDGTPAFDNLLNGTVISTFYVDSLSHIYLLTFPPSKYLMVIDTLGNLVDTLNPLGWNSNFGVCAMFINSYNVLSVCTCNRELYTYKNGGFTPGGAMGLKALDGYYYYATQKDSTLIRFIRYSNPGLDGIPPDLEETFVPYNPYYLSCGLLGVDDNMRLFLSLFDNDSRSRIRIYNTSYELLDEIVFQPAPNKYDRYTGSHMHSDRTIFELRYTDDGFHIFRWSEQ